MINFPSFFSWAAAGLLAFLVLGCLLRGKFHPPAALFFLSSVVLGILESAQGLMLVSATPQEALSWLRVIVFCAILLPGYALSFFSLFSRANERAPARPFPLHLAGLTILLAAAALLRLFTYGIILLPPLILCLFLFLSGRKGRAVSRGNLNGMVVLTLLLTAGAFFIPLSWVAGRIHFTDDNQFWGLSIAAAGKLLGVFLLLSNVFILHSFENTYRAATIPGKVTLKYPLLGIISASVINFIVISRSLSLSHIDRNFLALHSCGLILFSVSFLYALFRYPLFEVQFRSYRKGKASVITITIAGLYLLAVSLISYISTLAGMPYDRFALWVLGIFIIFLLLAAGISGKSRRRLRRFINENFYPGRYNYRKEWRHYARLMASSSTIEEFLSNTISSLCETMLVRKGIIWVDTGGGKSSSYGVAEEERDAGEIRALLDYYAGSPVVTFKRPRPDRLRASAGKEKPSAPQGRLGWINALAFLSHGEELRGLIALGGKDIDTPFSYEDREFLATIADQAMLTLENLLMEERFLESRQMESFHRFSAYVIHDLKNTLGMLSLTAENARDNIQDAEFQRDAVTTLNRSVEKMRRLIDSLRIHQGPVTLSTTKVPVNALLLETALGLKKYAGAKKIDLVVTAEHEITATADPLALKRVLENLVLNALEACGSGGKISVALEEINNSGFSITVSDSGEGFDPVYLDNHLFKPFCSTKKNGLGIGLVLCKSLVEAHGGSISIGNRPGEGADVRVLFPGSPAG
ncbi:MAG: PEP-CTERM system histidine kinase PrsK [Candidatus Krumholzibacteriota bacterium]|nr:PEP-CTERM system histidine kinase PrsK [Candidatus Krumholzibacteriota bacterium]